MNVNKLKGPWWGKITLAHINGRQVHLRMCKSELAALILWTQFMKYTRQKQRQLPLPHMAKYFCQSLSTEYIWLLCLCQDAVTESTSSSLHGNGLIIGYLLADSFWKGQEITFCDTPPGLTCVQTAQFLKQNNLIHCITLGIQKARGQIPDSKDLCQRCCGQSNSLHSEQS